MKSEPYHIIVTDGKKSRVLPINIPDKTSATNLAMKVTDEYEPTEFTVQKGRVKGPEINQKIEYNKAYKFQRNKKKTGEWYKERSKFRKDSKREKKLGKGMNLMKILYE